MNLELESVFRNADKNDCYPVVINRMKKGNSFYGSGPLLRFCEYIENGEEIIQENYDRKYPYANGLYPQTRFKMP